MLEAVRARLALLASVGALAVGAATAAPVAAAPVVALKPCGAGWVHATLSWGHKCLRRGQFCKSYEDREYHRYGFHCHTGRLQ